MHYQVKDIVHFLLPNGSRGDGGGIDQPPRWPPDIFAVVAYLAEKSDCYCELLDYSRGGVGENIVNCKDDLHDTGRYWSQYSNLSLLPDAIYSQIHDDWQTLACCEETVFYDKTSRAEKPEWVGALLRLLIIADIACAGIGFYDPASQKVNEEGDEDVDWIKRVYAWMSIPELDRPDIHKNYPGDNWYSLLQAEVAKLPAASFTQKSSPTSACILVPKDRLCVLPKALTPTVGCTIRSLTQSLSLHPSAGQVKSRWYNHEFDIDEESLDKLNVLIIPYPYRIKSTSFAPSSSINKYIKTFSVQQDWLHEENKICEITRALMREVKAEGRNIDVVLLPELALNTDAYRELANAVADESEGRLTMLVSGVSVETKDGDHINASLTAYIENGDIQVENDQAKHHRWKMDGTQIKTYALEEALCPDQEWWEEAYIGDRKVDYHVFQKGACFATLICEDLARQDPCKNSIQAVGPNLIFALLMDAPQLCSRWPGRYTLGLTEDPGSSVLTVTSLGLLERSNWAFNGTRRTIALWGNKHGVREIDLPPEHHGVLLALSKTEETSYTLDYRKGGGTSWILRSVTPMKVDELVDML